MEQISRIGMDTSKHIFQLHGVNATEKVVLRKKLRRKEMEVFFEKLAPAIKGIEACGRIDPGFAVVPDQVEAIAAQSLSTLNRVGAKAVLAQTYNVAKREGISFHLSYIDRDRPDSGGTGFETDAMRQLYDYGYKKARSGAFWVTDLSQVEAAKAAGQ